MIDEFCEKPNILSVSEPIRMCDTGKELQYLLAQDWGRSQWGEKSMETKALQGYADKRQCEIKDIKLCQVRTKLIALGWHWVTMICLGQINPKIHFSSGKHNVQVITKNWLSISLKASWKWTILVNLYYISFSILGDMEMHKWLWKCITETNVMENIKWGEI